VNVLIKLLQPHTNVILERFEKATSRF